MSKHKRLHGTCGKGKYSKFSAFANAHYDMGCARHPKRCPPIMKKTPASAANADEGRAEHVDHDVSASNDTKSKEDLQP